MEVLNNIAKQFVVDANADGKIDAADVASSIEKLFADASGKLDLSGLVAKLQNSGFSETVASWLGDGQNKAFSVDDLSKLFDSEKLSQFAASLNLDVDAAKAALATAIPNLIDQVSSGGNLMEKISEQATKLQAEAAQIADSVKAVAEEKTEGLLAKIKKLLG
ncbi:MAG: YidB family protein [Methylococcales bacterium]